MPTHPLKFFKTCVTYSDIFGRPFDRNELKQAIGAMPWGALLNVAAQMLASPMNSRDIRKKFYSSMVALGFDRDALELLTLRYSGSELVHPQGLLAVCKWLLAYGDPAKFDDPADTNWAIGATVHLCIIVSDYLYEHVAGEAENDETFVEDVLNELISNFVFNAPNDPFSAIARTHYIYMQLGTNRALYSPKEYVDFSARFEEVNGYCLEDYLSVLFAMSMTLTQLPHIEVGWVRDLKLWFSQTGMAGLAERIAREQLLVTLDEAREWAVKTIDWSWDYGLFQAKPLIAVGEQCFFPVYHKFVHDQIFQGLFHKIRHCYPEEDQNFMRFFGRPFEEYVKLLVKQGVETSGLPYQVYPEFIYQGSEGEKKSPDVMLRLGDRLLAIEVKSLRMRQAGIIGGNSGIVESDLERMVLDPLMRAHDKLVDLMRPREEVDLSGIKEIYLMVVTMGEFPTLPGLESRLQNELSKHYTLQIKGSLHLDIEEFEYLAGLLSRHQPVFRVLKNKVENEPFHSFRSFLSTASLARKRPTFVSEAATRFAHEVMRTRLFPEPKD